MIEAGTIGSNLGNLLAKNGTGIGKNAMFTVVDCDEYVPYNFPRHFLGIRHSGNNKASSLKIELEYAFPFIKIDAIAKSVQNIDFHSYDIIIDSTGEESLTQWINEKIIEGNIRSLFISTWVYGQGDAVECFALPNNKGACHECFRKSKKYTPFNLTSLPIRDPCNSIYMPFPITASMYAALLVINIVNKWFERKLTETTIFTQKLNPVSGITEVMIPKYERCPLCGKN